jgi:hypothetical protein
MHILEVFRSLCSKNEILLAHFLLFNKKSFVWNFKPSKDKNCLMKSLRHLLSKFLLLLK